MAKSDDKSKESAEEKHLKDSAQQIWLAGLGAFAKAQQEGTKVFESLVKEGVGMQRKTQAAAEETFTQAQSRFTGFASEFGARAAGQWGKLENIFEDRVARALEKLGVPHGAEVEALKARIDALERELKRVAGGSERPARKTAAARSTADAAKPSRRHPARGKDGSA